MDEDGGNCSFWCCVNYILAVGVMAVLLWLTFPLHEKPKCSIQYLYVPALNKSLSAPPLNTTLNFMLRLDNPNRQKGIYYDEVDVSISNTIINTSTPSLLAIYTVPKFYQGYKKKAEKWGQALPFNEQAVLRALLPNGSAVFRLELKTQVRFKVLFWKTDSYGIKVGANVEVNGEGAKAAKEEIKMKKSDSSSPLRTSFSICALVNLLVFFFAM